DQRVPKAHEIKTALVRPRHPGILWERWGLGRYLRCGDLLFAPTNLIPGSWRGPTVLVVHDTLQQLRPGDFPWHVRWRFERRYRVPAQRAPRILVHTNPPARDIPRFFSVDPKPIRVIPPAAGHDFRPPSSNDPPSRAILAAEIPALADAPYFLFAGK